jgi:hypothetical protein
MVFIYVTQTSGTEWVLVTKTEIAGHHPGQPITYRNKVTDYLGIFRGGTGRNF